MLIILVKRKVVVYILIQETTQSNKVPAVMLVPYLFFLRYS